MDATSLSMRAAAYIRVSSKSQTLDMQRAAIERAAKARRDTIDEWFSDKQSARSLSRPGLERLRQAAREGRGPRLYVYRLDGLARSGIRDTFEVIEELAATPASSSPSPTASTSPARPPRWSWR
jgi:DNA invertase Pin-like site-specific DNA recombinase